MKERYIREPSACRHCGIPKRFHYQQWSPREKWHTWKAPTDEQIKLRMQLRRNDVDRWRRRSV